MTGETIVSEVERAEVTHGTLYKLDTVSSGAGEKARLM
jgi:hypothetical protein